MMLLRWILHQNGFSTSFSLNSVLIIPATYLTKHFSKRIFSNRATCANYFGDRVHVHSWPGWWLLKLWTSEKHFASLIMKKTIYLATIDLTESNCRTNISCRIHAAQIHLEVNGSQKRGDGVGWVKVLTTTTNLRIDIRKTIKHNTINCAYRWYCNRPADWDP